MWLCAQSSHLQKHWAEQFVATQFAHVLQTLFVQHWAWHCCGFIPLIVQRW